MRWWQTIAQRFRTPALMERMLGHFDVRARLAKRPGGWRALRRASRRCMACTDTEACEAWLDAAGEADAPPSFCRNAALIGRLRREAGGPR